MRMLDLHTRVSVISRSKPRSATGTAAYIAGIKIMDERTGLPHDYRRKRGVELTALFAQGDAPEFARDRAALWNAAEMHEKHPRAQTARAWQVIYPHEFSFVLRQEAGIKIAHVLLRRYGGAVDAAWHLPDAKGDQRNYHSHFLQTTRRFENGQWAKTKDRVLDDRVKGPKEIRSVREEIAAILNEIAVREHLPVTIEHLSFEERGIDREPTHHMGWKVAQIERRGEETDIGKKNREITARNELRRQLREERNVIDIELARGAVRDRNDSIPEAFRSAPDTQEERFRLFAIDTYRRRASMLEEFRQAYEQQEEELQELAQQLGQSLNRPGLVRLWRNLAGQDREKLAKTRARLYDIAEIRRQQQEDFERERLMRLEAMKAEEQEQERQRAAYAAQMLVQMEEDGGEERVAAPLRMSNTDDDAREGRRGYFRRIGARRKRQRQERTHDPPEQQQISPCPGQ